MATVFFIKWIELQLMFNMSALNEASASLPVSECTCCPHLYYPNLPEDNAVVCCTMSSSGSFFFLMPCTVCTAYVFALVYSQ